MEDRDILYQLINIEKELSNKYNKITMDCIDKKLRSEMNSILENQNNIIFNLKDELLKRNWTKTSKCDNIEANSVKNKYYDILSKL